MQETKTQNAIQLNNIAESAFELLSDARTMNEIKNTLIKSHFLFSYFRDILEASEDKIGENINALESLKGIMLERFKYLKNWMNDENKTIELIESNVIKPEEIKPHIRHPDESYVKFYENQNLKLAERMKRHKKSPFNKFKSHIKLVIRKNYDHIIRKSHAINVIETYMGILENLNIPINKKWLDIGCGVGLIANSVEPKKHGSHKWEIHGCDLQSNKIKVAQNRACEKRYFYQENVLQKLQQNSESTEEYDIISMFEFCEHFSDPYSIIEKIVQNSFKIVVIATPLRQKLNMVNDKTPDPVHLWSFTPEALIKILEKLGLKVIYHSETNVGKHTKGLDWLTVIAAKPEIFKKISET